MIGKHRVTKPADCLNCGEVLAGASAVGMEGEPVPGAISVCFHCGHLQAFKDDLTFRELTPVEIKDVAGDPRLLAIQRARGEFWKDKGG